MGKKPRERPDLKDAPYGRRKDGRPYTSEKQAQKGKNLAAMWKDEYVPEKWKRGEGLAATNPAAAAFASSEREVQEPDAAAVDALIVDAARTSLAVYLGLVHRTDEGRQAIPPQHLLKHILPIVEDDTLGDTLIVAPPGSIKTNTMVGLCAWILGHHPDWHLGYICNNTPEAVERSLAIRDTVELSPEYRAIFPDIKPNKARGWASDRWYLERPNLMDKNASLSAFGVGGGLGKRLHRLILDDIADEDNQRTEQQRLNLHSWLGQTLATRLDPQHGRAIMICTRWHEDDPASYCIERGWHYVRIPALDEEGNSYWPERFPLINPIPGRKGLACPNQEHDPHRQCCYRKELGELGFARQYLGVLETSDTAMFKRHWWREFDDPLTEEMRGCITVDTAGWDNTSSTSDFAAVEVATTDGENKYVQDVQQGRWSFTEVEHILQQFRTDWGFPVVVENVPWARPLIERLQKVLGWGVIPWQVQGRSKINRAAAVAPLVESGNVFLKKGGPWVQKYIDQHAVFPDGKNDDLVDVGTMATTYLLRNAGRRKPTTKALPFKRSWESLSA